MAFVLVDSPQFASQSNTVKSRTVCPAIPPSTGARSFTLLSDCPTHTTRGLNSLSLPAFKCFFSPFLPFFFYITRNPFERLHCDSVLEICSFNSEP